MADTPQQRWMASVRRPRNVVLLLTSAALLALAMTVGGAMIAAASMLLLATLLLISSEALRTPPVDPLAAAGPAIAWSEAQQTVRSPTALSLLARLQRVDDEVTALAREAPATSQPMLVAALAAMRPSLAEGLSLLRAMDRLDALLAEGGPLKARLGAAALHVRALLSRDRKAADAYYDAAEQRASYADRAEQARALRARLQAEGEQLAAQLEHAALDAASIASRAARAQGADRVRVDVQVVRAVLSEYDELEASLHESSSAPQRARREQ